MDIVDFLNRQNISKKDFAEIIGISERGLYNWFSSGVLRDGGTCGEWMMRYCERLREEAAGRAGDEQGSLARARTREAQVSADLKELQIMEKAGKLVPVDQIEPLLIAMVTAARTELLALSEKVVHDIKSLYGLDVDPALITEKVHASLTHLSSMNFLGVNGADESEESKYELNTHAQVFHGSL